MELKIAFIVNPISGAKNKTHLPELIHRIAEQNGLEVDVYFTEYPNHASTLAKELVAAGYCRIVAVGGDGTINEIGRQLINTSSALCIIPQGSGNGLARHLHIPLNPQKAIEVALTNPVSEIDTAYINDTPFFCTAGVGFDALISNKFAESNMRGFSAYAAITTKEFFTYKPQTYKITVDGVEHIREALLVTVANASQYGNNAFIAPHAHLQDGILNVVSVTAFPLIEAPFFAAKMFLKITESSRFVETFKGRHIFIERAADDYVHYDGEPGKMGPMLEFKVMPSSLKIVF